MKFSFLLNTLNAYDRQRLSIFTTVSGFLLVLLISASAWAGIPVHIVYDLDWTLINPTTEKMALAEPKNTFQLDGKIFRFSDHLFEILAEQHAQPDVKISFYSGGSEERNHAVVKLIYERLNQVYPGFNYKPELILSTQHLVKVSDDTKLKFSQRFKKNLQRFFDLSSSVLIEDISGFILTGQEKNEIWLGKTYNDRPRFDLAPLEDSKDANYSAPNYEEWLRDRHKLLPVHKIILNALQMTRENSLSFVENVNTVKSAVRRCQNLFN